MNNVGSYGDKENRIGPNVPHATTVKPAVTSGAANVAKETLSALNTQKAAQSSPVLSASNLSPLMEETKEQAIKNRDGHLWHCVDRIPADEGFIYKFKLRKEYDTIEHFVKENHPSVDAVNKKNGEIFPAVEGRVDVLTDPYVWNWVTYLMGSKYEPEYEEMKGKLERGEIEAIPVPINSRNVNEVLLTMGYKLEITKTGINLYLPDENVLQTRWNKMVNEPLQRKLPELSILSSQDIATDEEFTQAYIEKKMVLSTGSEFVHDHQVHFLSALKYMIDNPENYAQVRDRFSALVAGLVEKIEKARGLIVEMRSKVGPTTAKEHREYCKRLEKNMVLANTIPAIVADNLATASGTTNLSNYDMNRKLSSWKNNIYEFENFIKERHAKEISENYKKEHNGAEIPSAELAAQMEGISLIWLFQEISKVLGE